MAISKAKKEQIVQELTAEFKQAKSVAFALNKGLSVANQIEFRNKLRENKSRAIVAKKTLFKIAAREAGLQEIPPENLTGPIMAIFAQGDELVNFQEVQALSKTHKTVKLTGGILAGENLTEQKAQQLACLPRVATLRGQFLGLLAAPLRSLVGVLNAAPSNFVRTLSEIQKKAA